MEKNLPENTFSSVNSAGVRSIFLLFFFTLYSSVTVSAQTPEAGMSSSTGLEYQIARWSGFRKAAFTISFDDNYRYQVTLANPILNQHHYKATYFIVTNRVGKGWAPGWDTINMLALQGHEIGSHSKNHPNFANLCMDPSCADSVRHEFRDSRDTIDAHVPYRQCETFAWPDGATNDTAIKISKNYYLACRGSYNNYEGKDPVSFYNIASQHIYHDTPLETVNQYLDIAFIMEGWLVERWHGFRIGNDTNGYEPVPIQIFEDHMNHVALKEDSLWIAPLGSVVKYIRERDASVLSFIDSTGFKVAFSLTNNLSDPIVKYDVPLSLKVKLTGKMVKISKITQGNNTLPFSVVGEEGSSYIYFDALPNDSLIQFRLFHPPSGVNELMAISNGAENYPNPFTISTTVLFDLPETELTDIRIFDQNGRKIRDYSNYYPAGRNSVEFDGRGLKPGVYNCIVSTHERKTDIRMVIKN